MSRYAQRGVDHVLQMQAKYNLFTHIDHEVSRQLNSIGRSGRLVAAIKDNIVTKDMPTTCGSKLLANYRSPFDATVVELLRQNHIALLGKTNLDEFGMGSGGIHSAFGVAKNPLYPDKDVILGGSSSGAAGAVAAGIVDFSLGTDTGGSVRLPAAYTATMGFKPSYGRLSRYGVVAYAQSLDTVGIISHDVNIIGKVFALLDKHDQKDPTSLSPKLRSQIKHIPLTTKPIRIGIPQEFSQSQIPDDTMRIYQKFIGKLLNMGYEIYPVSIPSIKYALPVYYTIALAEAASNLSRYDGIRFGTRDSMSDKHMDTLFAPTRSNFGKNVKDRILLGNYNLCSGSFQNNFLQAQQLRTNLVNEFDEVFNANNVKSQNHCKQNGVDLILGLTAMHQPRSIETFKAKTAETPINEYINDVFTVPMSLAGLPTISIPMEKDIPLGIQLVGQYGTDKFVLEVADALTQKL